MRDADAQVDEQVKLRGKTKLAAATTREASTTATWPDSQTNY